MVCLPTFGRFLGQMLVNILYTEHMGIVFYSVKCEGSKHFELSNHDIFWVDVKLIKEYQ